MLIERDADFLVDLENQVGYLFLADERRWISMLQEDLYEALELLASFPEAGQQVSLQRRPRVRRLRLRRTPFVIWYRVTANRQRLVLLRLFHARQLRPD